MPKSLGLQQTGGARATQILSAGEVLPGPTCLFLVISIFYLGSPIHIWVVSLLPWEFLLFRRGYWQLPVLSSLPVLFSLPLQAFQHDQVKR